VRGDLRTSKWGCELDRHMTRNWETGQQGVLIRTHGGKKGNRGGGKSSSPKGGGKMGRRPASLGSSRIKKGVKEREAKKSKDKREPGGGSL